MRASDKIVKASLTTIGKAMAGLDDQATWFQPGAEVAPGVTVTATATPGHTSFAVASGSACMRAPPGVAIIPEPLRRGADWQVTDDRHADPAAAARHAFHAKAATELGYRPRPVREAVADAVAWFRANRLLSA